MGANETDPDNGIPTQERRLGGRREADIDIVRFRELVHRFPTLSVHSLAADGTVRFWNRGAELLYGYHAEEALGRNVFDFHVPPDHHDDLRRTIDALHLSRQTLPPRECALIHREGHTIRVLRHHIAFELEDDTREVIVVDADLTEHHRDRQRIAAGEARYRRLFESMSQGAFTVDRDGRIVDVNEAALRMFRLDREEFLGRPGQDPAWTIFDEHEKPLPYERHPSTIAIETGVPIRNQTLSARVGTPPETIWFEVTAIPEFDHEPYGVGPADRAVVFIHDLTERIRSRRRITSLLHEKESLLRELHHRVRNNLAVIRSMLTLQASSLSEPEAVEALTDAANRVTSIHVLYDRLLAHGTDDSIAVGAYLPSLVGEITATYPNRGFVRVTTETDQVSLDAKTVSLLGIITNELVTNALKYAYTDREEGSLRVELRRRDDRIELIVRDDGPGPAGGEPSGEKPARAGPAEDGREGGFGLTFIRNITDQLRGEFRMEYDGGTRCVVSFPQP